MEIEGDVVPQRHDEGRQAIRRHIDTGLEGVVITGPEVRLRSYGMKERSW